MNENEGTIPEEPKEYPRFGETYFGTRWFWDPKGLFWIRLRFVRCVPTDINPEPYKNLFIGEIHAYKPGEGFMSIHPVMIGRPYIGTVERLITNGSGAINGVEWNISEPPDLFWVDLQECLSMAKLEEYCLIALNPEMASDKMKVLSIISFSEKLLGRKKGESPDGIYDLQS